MWNGIKFWWISCVLLGKEKISQFCTRRLSYFKIYYMCYDRQRSEYSCMCVGFFFVVDLHNSHYDVTKFCVKENHPNSGNFVAK
jgi:hypothetical protein